ncbi:MAG: hypothetical protein Q4Q14_00570 [Methanobrevibacter sp.]|nr:hypothetical protein [Methanobrevibacter sp.]
MKLKHFLIIGFAIAIVSIGFVSAADDDVSMLSALDITPFSDAQDGKSVQITGNSDVISKVIK